MSWVCHTATVFSQSALQIHSLQDLLEVEIVSSHTITIQVSLKILGLISYTTTIDLPKGRPGQKYRLINLLDVLWWGDLKQKVKPVFV